MICRRSCPYSRLIYKKIFLFIQSSPQAISKELHAPEALLHTTRPQLSCEAIRMWRASVNQYTRRWCGYIYSSSSTPVKVGCFNANMVLNHENPHLLKSNGCSSKAQLLPGELSPLLVWLMVNEFHWRSSTILVSANYGQWRQCAHN